MVEHGLSTSGEGSGTDALPYDSDDWERRLEIARARREEVLRERAEAKAGRPEPVGEAEMPRADASRGPGFAAPPRPAITLRAPARPAAPPRRVWPSLLLGLALGGAVGGVAATLAMTRPAPAPDVAVAVAPEPGAPVAPQVVTVRPVAASEASAPPVGVRVGTERVAAPPPGPVPAAPTIERVPGFPGAAGPTPPPDARSDAPAIAPPSARSDGTGPAPRTGGGGAGGGAVDDAPRPMRPPAPDANAVAGIAPQPTPPRATGPAAPADAPADGPSARVGVHLPATYAFETRDRVLLRLAELGWPTVEVATPYTIARTHVRYYHAADRAAAETLAARIGGAARDFTRFSPSPAAGYVEVWLGSGESPATPFDPVAAPAAPPTRSGGITGGAEGDAAFLPMAPRGAGGGGWHARRLEAWRDRATAGPAAVIPAPSGLADLAGLDGLPRADLAGPPDDAARVEGRAATGAFGTSTR